MNILNQSIEKLREDILREAAKTYNGDIAKTVEEGLYVELEKEMYDKGIHTSVEYDINFDFKTGIFSVNPKEFENEAKKVKEAMFQTEEYKKFHQVVEALQDKRSVTSAKNGNLGGRPPSRDSKVKVQVNTYLSKDIAQKFKKEENKSRLLAELLEKHYK